jgi:Bacteriophytochrome (light-regulated signal transduction histidine kinase)
MPGFQFFRNLSVAKKFILWFLLVALVPLIIATYISYENSSKALSKEVENSLMVVADNRANKVESYLVDKKKSLATLSHMSEVIEAAQKLCETSADGWTATEEFHPLLRYFQESSGYTDIFIVGPKGNTVFSVSGQKSAESRYGAPFKIGESSFTKVLSDARVSAQIEVSDFEYYPKSKNVIVFIASPLFSGSSIIGFIVAEMDNKGLSEIAGDYAALGKTGETMLVTRSGDEIAFVAPLRFDQEAVFGRRSAIGSDKSIELKKAVSGESGSGRLTDYRGENVFAVWRYLPTFRLGMVVKMDTSEVLESARDLRVTLVKIAGIILILTVLAALAIANSIAKPIRELTRISAHIASGDLAARVKVISDDELGKLAGSFNRMTDSLVYAMKKIKEKNIEVEEQKALLEAVNKELDSFVYTVSHDLRAPLRGIEGFANFLKEDYSSKLDKEGADYLARIIAGTGRMRKLIDDLLSLSRISRIMNPYEMVDINELIRSVLARIEFDIKKNNVRMTVANDMPTAYCDKIKIGEVFLNLINNAVKFSSKDISRQPTVEIGWQDREAAYEFFVKDNGIGIDKKYHREVFGIFRRLHTQDEYEGTGAGLSIVKKVIDDHKGSIWIESEPGKGASFCFTIPKYATKLKEGKLA